MNFDFHLRLFFFNITHIDIPRPAVIHIHVPKPIAELTAMTRRVKGKYVLEHSDDEINIPATWLLLLLETDLLYELSLWSV